MRQFSYEASPCGVTSVRPYVPTPVPGAARALAASVHADSVLCVGGGSTTGTTKAVALTGGLPFISVPTTYAASEVTPVWGITERAARRGAVAGDAGVSRQAAQQASGRGPRGGV